MEESAVSLASSLGRALLGLADKLLCGSGDKEESSNGTSGLFHCFKNRTLEDFFSRTHPLQLLAA